MKNTTILLPIHKLEEDDLLMLTNAVLSVEQFYENVKLSIICPKEIIESLKLFNFGENLEYKIITNETNKTDFISQINIGIQSCDTEWFSILEIDDEYKDGWLKNMNNYIKVYKNVDVFLPIIEDVNVEGKFVGFTNESVWSYGFAGACNSTAEQGYLDKDILLNYQNFQTSGGLYKTEVIKNNGLFKENIKLTFSYEFLLRLTNNNVIILGVPKIGYRHVNFRPNSLFWCYKNNETMKMSDNEVKFWIETAKNEYFFRNKRDIVYVSE